MIEELRNIKSGKTELKKFGIAFSIVFLILGAIAFFNGEEKALFFFIVSPIALSLGLFLPIALFPFQKLMASAFICLVWLVTRISLIVLFYLIITPMGLIAKMIGKKFLDVSFKDKKTSYWILKPEAAFEPKHYENQF